MNFYQLSVSGYWNFFSLLHHSIKLDELSFFLIIVDRADCCWNKDGNENGHSLDPSGWSMSIISGSDFNGDRENTSDHQYSEGEVFEGLTEELKKSRG